MQIFLSFIIVTIAMFGFLLPWLFSAASWVAVGTGVAFFMAWLYTLFMYLSHYQHYKSKEKQDE